MQDQHIDVGYRCFNEAAGRRHWCSLTSLFCFLREERNKHSDSLWYSQLCNSWKLLGKHVFTKVVESARGKHTARPHLCRTYSSNLTSFSLNFFIFLFSSCPQTFTVHIRPSSVCKLSTLQFAFSENWYDNSSSFQPAGWTLQKSDVSDVSADVSFFLLMGRKSFSGCLYESERNLSTFTLCPYKTSVVVSVGSYTKFLIKPNAAQLKVFQLGVLQNLTGLCRTGGDRALTVLTWQTWEAAETFITN